MNGKAPHHAGARFIQPDDFDRRSLAAELHHRVIQDRNGRDVPEMRIGHVNHHAIKHFAFRIKDRGLWERTVEKEGLRLYYGGAIDYPHSQSWYVHDPNGYEIEVAAWDEGRARFDSPGA